MPASTIAWRSSDVRSDRLSAQAPQTQWHNGWTVGAGWEYGITQNWIVGLEYDYSAFADQALPAHGAAAPASIASTQSRAIVQSVVARVSYKFSGPLVARY